MVIANEKRQKPSVFISYAHGEDDAFIDKLYTDLKQKGIPLWLDHKEMRSQGQTFLQQMRDSVASLEHLVLVVSPKAVGSKYVRVEWEFAYKNCRIIIPILREGDYDVVPEELSELDCLDFRATVPYQKSFKRLVRNLIEPAPSLAQLQGVPDLPPHYIPRPNELERLKNNVLTDVYTPEVISDSQRTTVIQGMGGIGKSVMAAAFGRSCDTRRAFSDGIIWLRMGNDTLDLIGKLRFVGKLLGDVEAEQYIEEHSASGRISTIMEDKVCLIVVDDVWNVKHLQTLVNALGPRSRLLITTRDKVVVTALGAQEQTFDVLDDDQAITLLSSWADQSPEDLPLEAREVVAECGNLPLALAMIGAMVRGQPNRWPNVLHKLRNADLKKIRQQFPNYEHENLMLAIQISVDALDVVILERYLDFAVFPEDTWLAEETLQIFWEPEGLDKFDTQDVLDELERRSLLHRDEAGISLHDLQLDYVRSQCDIKAAHQRLILAYWEKCSTGWSTGPNDGYFFQHLVYHLCEAGRREEARSLLTNFDWLRAQLGAAQVGDLIADCSRADNNDELRAIQGALRLSSHTLAREPDQLAAQLVGRLCEAEPVDVRNFVERIRNWTGTPWLCPMYQSLTPPGSNLMLTLSGHSKRVLAVTTTPDGKWALSASDDRTIRVWDLENGEEVKQLTGHEEPVTSITTTSDNRRFVSASEDGSLKLWDLKKGEEIRTFNGHEKIVATVALTPDDGRAISGSWDRTLRVWDLDNGEELLRLQGHQAEVLDVVVTADGRFAVSGSADRTIKVWDLETGKELRTLDGHKKEVMALALTPDGKMIVSASADQTLKVWYLDNGELKFSLVGHTMFLKGVAVTPDGRRAVSVEFGYVMKVWDIERGVEEFTIPAEDIELRGVCVTPDGGAAITASEDGTLKVWDITHPPPVPAPPIPDRVSAILLSPDERKALIAAKELQVWSLEDPGAFREFGGYLGNPTSLDITSDGELGVYTGWGNEIKIWRYGFPGNSEVLAGHSMTVNQVALTADGRRAVSASDDGTLKVWDLKKRCEVITLAGHTGPIRSLALTLTASAISGSADGSVRVWDLESGKERQQLERSEVAVARVAISRDEKLVFSSSEDGHLEVNDIITGKSLRQMKVGGLSSGPIAVLGDGPLVAFISKNGSLRVLDSETGSIIAGFTADEHLTALAATRDGMTLITGDARTGVHILCLQGTG